MNAATIKRGILLFWTLWIGSITLTNLFSFFKAMGVLMPVWPFASHNFELVRTITTARGEPSALAELLFGSIVAWQAVASARFWEAFRSYGRDKLTPVFTAFGLSLALWAAFLLAGEFFLHFEYEGIHMRIAIAQLASLLAIVHLPE